MSGTHSYDTLLQDNASVDSPGLGDYILSRMEQNLPCQQPHRIHENMYATVIDVQGKPHLIKSPSSSLNNIFLKNL